MSLLASVPVGIIKIDHQLVSRLLEDQAARDITVAMISMAHQFGVKVVAENVESQAQCDFLITHGCDYAQGFWFQYPRPLPELAELLRHWQGELAIR